MNATRAREQAPQGCKGQGAAKVAPQRWDGGMTMGRWHDGGRVVQQWNGCEVVEQDGGHNGCNIDVIGERGGGCGGRNGGTGMRGDGIWGGSSCGGWSPFLIFLE